ncbi:MAG: hypothetical protein HZA29_01845 [Candidatus Omnitrophica bacterium]|nr:hypothetical protein [Candidatus Omnitrophota bacterium]
MDDDSAKIIKAIVTFLVVVLCLKVLASSSLFKSSVHKGHGYSFVPPAGWEQLKDPRGVSPVFEAADKPEVVMFAVPGKVPNADIPVASMAVLTVKLANPTWLEDDFPTLIDALVKAGYRLIDRGQIKIDNNVFWWVFYQDPESSLVSFEFYMVNDINRLYKIQYTAAPDAFKQYRPAFEASKDTFKISAQLW